MAAIAGVSILLKVNTGTDGAPVWTNVGGQRDCELKLDSDAIDVTSKDSNGWEQKLVGLNKWSIDFDGLFLEDDAAYDKLESAFMNRQLVAAQMVLPSGTKYQAKGIIKLNISAPYKAEATVKGSLEGAEGLTIA